MNYKQNLALPVTHDDLQSNPKRVYGKASNKSFSLGLDLETYRSLVVLQKTYTTPNMEPSRTLITRQALLRYALETSRRLHQDDTLWIEEQLKELQHLGFKGSK